MLTTLSWNLLASADWRVGEHETTGGSGLLSSLGRIGWLTRFAGLTRLARFSGSSWVVPVTPTSVSGIYLLG